MASSRRFRSGSFSHYAVSLSLAALLSASVPGCMDADPFRLAYRRIAGEYELFETELHDYYLTRDRHEFNGVGYIEGKVQKLGWTKDHIFARRYSSSRGDPDGWMIIYLRTDVMIGPISDEEFHRRFPRAVVYPVAEAWELI
jgi:hypothetical protein